LHKDKQRLQPTINPTAFVVVGGPEMCLPKQKPFYLFKVYFGKHHDKYQVKMLANI